MLDRASLDVFSITNGLLKDLTISMYPTLVWGYEKGGAEFTRQFSCYYCFALEGKIEIKQADGTARWDFLPGMYLSSSSPFVLSGTGKVMVIERLGYRGFFNLGGPVENRGRLTYIDQCTSSLLIPPSRMGDPCLNLLHFPENIKQTSHIHPTIRVGCVVGGEGWAIDSRGNETPLYKNDCFFIDQNIRHCFMTKERTLSVVAYHPDSDWGPTDQVHPMLNRTYLK